MNLDRRLLAALTTAVLVHAAPTWAQSPGAAPSELQVAVWAASCMACHGTDGRADGTSLSLHGRTADQLFSALRAYRNGEREGTIMQHHAKGYTEAELQSIARHFASRR